MAPAVIYGDESIMASTKDYLDYILGQLSGIDDISCRPMMGEYVLYCGGKVFGGIYDDRFLIKPTKSAVEVLGEPEEIPYDGAKPMLMPDPDDRELLSELIPRMTAEIPSPKKKKK